MKAELSNRAGRSAVRTVQDVSCVCSGTNPPCCDSAPHQSDEALLRPGQLLKQVTAYHLHLVLSLDCSSPLQGCLHSTSFSSMQLTCLETDSLKEDPNA